MPKREGKPFPFKGWADEVRDDPSRGDQFVTVRTSKGHDDRYVEVREVPKQCKHERTRLAYTHDNFTWFELCDECGSIRDMTSYIPGRWRKPRSRST